MGAVTNRQCGTCRFFQVGGSTSQGRCRNPAYPRRDELALLRASELGCREGWGRDFWAPANAEAVHRADEQPPASPRVAISALASESAPAEAHSPTSQPLDDFGARFTPLVPALASGDQDVVIRQDAAGAQHPELNDQGVPLPRARRSTVREAHRRAIERQKNDRQASEKRSAPPPLPARQMPSPVAKPPLSAAIPLRTGPVPTVSEAPTEVPSRSRSDSTLTGLPAAIGATPALRGTAPTPASPRRDAHGPSEMQRPERPAETRDETPAAAEPRYWDAPSTGSRFVRMRPTSPTPPTSIQELPRAEQAPDVRQVGRSRPPAGENERPERTIRALDRTTEKPIRRQPVGEAREKPADSLEAPFEAPLPPPRRQADPALVQRLATEWREQAVQARGGHRCGTCRYFRGGDGARGQCDAVGAPTYRQVVPAQDIACLSPLGAWWIAGDAGWLEKTLMPRPGRATPLLDALDRDVGVHEPVMLEQQGRGR